MSRTPDSAFSPIIGASDVFFDNTAGPIHDAAVLHGKNFGKQIVRIG